MRSLLSVAVSVVVGVMLLTGSREASATTMMPLDLAAMTTRAELVVSGKVVDSRAKWSSDHEAIYTEVTILVDRVLEGAAKAGDKLVVRREGGTVDGIGMKVYGAATFTKDEQVVVFLEKRGAYRYVVGMSQGKLQLLTDAAGVRRLRRDLSEIAFTGPAPAPERALSTLDELAVEVARLARTKKAK